MQISVVRRGTSCSRDCDLAYKQFAGGSVEEMCQKTIFSGTLGTLQVACLQLGTWHLNISERNGVQTKVLYINIYIPAQKIPVFHFVA